MSSTDALEDIKPPVDERIAVQLAAEEYGLTVDKVKELNSYDDKNYHLSVTSSNNPNIASVSPSGYVLKITNSLDSQNENLFHAQNELLIYLHAEGLTVPLPAKTVNGEYVIMYKPADKSDQRAFVTRLMVYLPGHILRSIQSQLPLYHELGAYLAKLDISLKHFSHPAYENHTSIWHMKSALQLLPHISSVKDNSRIELVKEVLADFEKNIQGQYSMLETGLIHGDFNESNVLVLMDKEGNWHPSAFLDFGDANYAPFLFEVGAAMAYMLLEALRNELDMILVGKEFLSGYNSVRPIPQLEKSLLKTAICTRICQSLVLGLSTMELQPENPYIASTQQYGWRALETLWRTPDKSLMAIWS